MKLDYLGLAVFIGFLSVNAVTSWRLWRVRKLPRISPIRRREDRVFFVSTIFCVILIFGFLAHRGVIFRGP